MLKAIYLERYKKPLIALCLVIIGICLLNAKLQSDHWHSMHTQYTENREFKQNVAEYRDQYTYFDPSSQTNKAYDSYEEFVNANLYFYRPTSDQYNPANLPEATDYDQKENYTADNTSNFPFLFLLVPLIGFLLFFVDAKTGFNHFLFSLPISRKEIFGKKLLYLGVPILLSVLVGQGLYALLIHSLIPAPYMNATLGQLFASVISYFFTMVGLFSASAFVGSMVGNIVFGPLTWFVFWLLMLSIPDTIYTVLDIITLRNGNAPSVSHNLFITFIGKNGGYWWISLLICLASGLLLFWSYRKYQTISLENDGSYLLNKESRWPVWIFMTLFSSAILGTTLFSPWHNYYMNHFIGEPVSIWDPINSSLIILAVLGLLSFTLVFFSDIKRKLQQRKTAILSKQ
ncbi:ABC transporter permease [Enterococcus sp. 669A]|uniref:ABC transporter permease n=1 Tax=Candidatus Enterococcus moelleringii TaxID=2815325 RepID=A0ABS3LFU8_9ENTE|nr:ABC transporter permease [Enterococcus sp. 669A]MBO1308519.1 ABC transporter permease [Enterococcus sp. 669A]